MHRSATIALLAALAVATGCGGGDGGGGDGDESSIERSLRAYFVFDKSPDLTARRPRGAVNGRRRLCGRRPGPCRR
jgi:hypothetical protein